MKRSSDWLRFSCDKERNRVSLIANGKLAVALVVLALVAAYVIGKHF
jgi:hypothetical protein